MVRLLISRVHRLCRYTKVGHRNALMQSLVRLAAMIIDRSLISLTRFGQMLQHDIHSLPVCLCMCVYMGRQKAYFFHDGEAIDVGAARQLVDKLDCFVRELSLSSSSSSSSSSCSSSATHCGSRDVVGSSLLLCYGRGCSGGSRAAGSQSPGQGATTTTTRLAWVDFCNVVSSTSANSSSVSSSDDGGGGGDRGGGGGGGLVIDGARSLLSTLQEFVERCGQEQESGGGDGSRWALVDGTVAELQVR